MRQRHGRGTAKGRRNRGRQGKRAPATQTGRQTASGRIPRDFGHCHAANTPCNGTLRSDTQNATVNRRATKGSATPSTATEGRPHTAGPHRQNSSEMRSFPRAEGRGNHDTTLKTRVTNEEQAGVGHTRGTQPRKRPQTKPPTHHTFSCTTVWRPASGRGQPHARQTQRTQWS
jgi:hypothetical protein